MVVKGSHVVKWIHWIWNFVFISCQSNDVIMGAIASQPTSLPIVYLTAYSRRRSKEYQSSASLAFVRGTHRWPVNSSHKGPVTRKMFPFDDVTKGRPACFVVFFLFSCDQAALWMVFSVCPSVCLSVRHTFLTMFPSWYHHEIFWSYHHGPG